MRYGNVISALPKGTHGLTASHIDALRSYRSGALVLAPLDPAATTLYNGGANTPGGDPWYTAVDGTDNADVGHLAELYRHHPTEREGILTHLERLSFRGANLAARDLAQRAVSSCKDFDTKVTNALKEAPKTASEFEDRKAPKARLYLLCTRGAMATRLTLAQEGQTAGVFDATLGTNVFRFEKLKAVDSIDTLHAIIRDFQTSILLIGKNGGRVAWTPFWDVVYEMLTASQDARFVHEMIFEALVKMDEGRIDPLTFMERKWTTFFMVFNAKFGENVKASSSYPGGSPTDGNSGDYEDGNPGTSGAPGMGREHVKFGPVTKQGEWCGEMRTRSGAIAFCNKWNEHKDCNRGIFAGRNKGKCAYTHKCRYCMSTQHRMVDKHPAGHANAGEWVCPKHP